MLKNRMFLIGLGSGIIIGALLFQLMLMGEQSNQNLQNIDKELNDKLYTQDEVDAMIEAERDSAKIDEQLKSDEVTKVQPSPSPSIKPASSNTEGAKEKEQAATAAEKKSETIPAKHVIRIEEGLNLTNTAKRLAKYNIIDDQAAFIKQMKSTKKLVRAGYFLFPEAITVDQAVKIVTSEPLTRSEAVAITTDIKSK
ncbi:hypothetical protein [Paenibacillus sp. sgz302251]|uniref:hypothetical protein n=1 Tax=Paenibacillus sp. sgz302251 TaxID=3414493 RepID=UPI003C7983DF